MTEAQIITLLTRLGCRRIRTRAEHVYSTCPNEGAHRGGRDKHPSYSVKINENGVSKAHCMACGFKDSAEWIARVNGWDDLAGSFRRTVDDPDYFHIPATNRGLWAVPEPSPLLPPESSLEPYVGRVPQYILSRGFTLETCRAWELGYDMQYKRAIFVIRDRLGRLRGISGRTIVNSRAKYLHYVWDHRLKQWSHGYGKAADDPERFKDFEKWRRNLLLLGEHMVNWERAGPDRQCIIIVEGHTDAIWLWQLGWVGLAVMGSSMSEKQAETVVQMLPKDGYVVTMADGDDGGRTLAASIRKQLIGNVPLFECQLPDGLDPQGQSDDVILSWMKQRRLAVAA